MKRYLLSIVLCAACGSTPTVDDVPDSAANTGSGDLAMCESAASVSRSQIDMLNTAKPATGHNAGALYRQFDAGRTMWEQAKAPCEDKGAAVMERAQIASDVNKAYEAADASYTERVLRDLQANPDDAWAFVTTRYSTGRAVAEEAVEATKDVALPRNKALLAKFEEHKKVGMLDKEFATTCIFSDQQIDPAEPPAHNFASVFTGRKHVHTLCRLPLPASKYAGDPDGQILLLLDNDDTRENGVVSEGMLGTVEKWKGTQYFRGRFSMPQGLEAPRDKAGYYNVSILIRRPKLGDEVPVTGNFVWYAE